MFLRTAFPAATALLLMVLGLLCIPASSEITNPARRSDSLRRAYLPRGLQYAPAPPKRGLSRRQGEGDGDSGGSTEDPSTEDPGTTTEPDPTEDPDPSGDGGCDGETCGSSCCSVGDSCCTDSNGVPTCGSASYCESLTSPGEDPSGDTGGVGGSGFSSYYYGGSGSASSSIDFGGSGGFSDTTTAPAVASTSGGLFGLGSTDSIDATTSSVDSSSGSGSSGPATATGTGPSSSASPASTASSSAGVAPTGVGIVGAGIAALEAVAVVAALF